MHPILFKLGPFTLHTYGVLVASGFILGLALAIREAKKFNIAKEKILDIGFYILISAIVGSRLAFILTEYEYYLENPLDIFKIWQGGLVFYGGLLLAIPVVIIYIKKHNLPMWTIGDIFAPSIAIGHAIGRLGCLSAGCCYGRPTDLPWAVTFTDPATLARPLGVPLHPTQLYEALAEFGIFVLLMFWRRHKSFDGQLFWLYILLYATARFIIEFFRAPETRNLIFNGLSLAQGISIALFMTAMIYLIRGVKEYAGKKR